MLRLVNSRGYLEDLERSRKVEEGQERFHEGLVRFHEGLASFTIV